MSVTILYKEQEAYAAAAGAAVAEGDDLWVAVDALAAATGWELRPEGACYGDMCVPIPHGREGQFLREGRLRFNIAALARWLGEPVVHDDAGGVWFFGEGAGVRRRQRESLQAPDFTLPDLEGRSHALADYRGKKVFLVSWASW